MLNLSLSKNRFSYKLGLYALMAFFALLSIKVNYIVSPGTETGSFIINFSKIQSSFSSGIFYDIFTYTAIFLLIRYVLSKEQRPETLVLLTAFLLAGLYIASMSLMHIGDLSFFLGNIYQLFLSLFCILGLSILFYCLLRLVYDFLDYTEFKESTAIKHSFAIAASVIFICWLPWIIINYPGSFCGDSEGQLLQYIGVFPIGAHHPPLSTIIMGLCYSAGKLLSDVNIGYFLYIFIQTICGSLIFGYSLSLIYKYGAPKQLYIAGIIFFSLVPVWPAFAQYFEKDLLYVEFFTLDICLLLPVLKDRRCSWKDAAKICLVTLLVVFLRNNGKYEILPFLIALIFWLRKSAWKKIASVVIVVFCVSYAVNSILYPALGVVPGSKREMLSLPFQQTARYVVTFPDELTEEELVAIDAVIPYDAWTEYDPEISDPVKNWYRGNDDALLDYFKVWLEMFFKHPRTYVEAALHINYGYLSPSNVLYDCGVHRANPDIVYDTLEVHLLFDESVADFFNSIMKSFASMPLINILVMSGTYSWILIACIVQLLRRRQYGALLLTIPGLMNLLVCIASPLNGSLRYSLPLMAITPLLIGWTLIFSKG